MTAEQLLAATHCIAEVIPLASLRSIVEQHPGVAQFDSLAKAYVGAADGLALAVVGQVIECYRAQQVLQVLIESLYELSHQIPGSERLRSLLEPGLPAGDRKEALLAKRDNFFLSQHLQSRLAEFMPKVCCIVGNFVLDGIPREKQGTGFLVGPDLVLTAMHVFEPLGVLDPARVAESYRVYFDHLEGAPISRFGATPAGVRCVGLAEQWRVAGACSFEQDGLIDLPDTQQLDTMKLHLDFVLVRLKEPVGFQPVSLSGGRLRSWIPLPDIDVPARLAHQERLVITQHPAGAAQSLDFGRFERVCQSQTRIFYSVSTAPGSSGAPCFNQQFELVGMHNAKLQPAGSPVAKANQAIRFDRIQAHIAAHIPTTALPAPTRLWNVSADPQRCRPVIGRRVLLKWIEDSTREDITSQERFFAMVPQAGQGGKSFTWEVLRHRLKDERYCLAVVFDKDRNMAPSGLEDFIATLMAKFNIPTHDDSPMPARAEGDNDKVRRWASQLVPQWFCARLEATRTQEVDRRELARQMVQTNEFLGRETDQELARLANHPEPIPVVVQRWAHAWLVFDDLHIMTLGQEVQDFLAGMAQMANSDNQSFAVLRRLRWMFLGKYPEFLDPSLVCVESIGERTYLDGIDELGQDIMSAAPYAKGEVIKEVIDTLKDLMEESGDIINSPASQLELLQRVASAKLSRKLPNWVNQ